MCSRIKVTCIPHVQVHGHQWDRQLEYGLHVQQQVNVYLINTQIFTNFSKTFYLKKKIKNKKCLQIDAIRAHA